MVSKSLREVLAATVAHRVVYIQIQDALPVVEALVVKVGDHREALPAKVGHKVVPRRVAKVTPRRVAKVAPRRAAKVAPRRAAKVGQNPDNQLGCGFSEGGLAAG